MYELRRVDRAGNDHTVLEHELYTYVCGQLKLERQAKPDYHYYIVNPDKVDIDCSDGLTDEEWELHP